MYRDRGLGGGMSAAKAEIGTVDRKRINDALDKHLEKSSPSTSRGVNGKEKERPSVPSTSAGKQHDHPAGLSKNKCSDGELFLLFFFSFMMYWTSSSFYGCR